MTSQDKTEKVIQALENPKYTWRTIRGITLETGLEPSVVESNISANGHIIIKSSSHNQNGEELFASRKVYRERVSPFIRLGSALTNRST